MISPWVTEVSCPRADGRRRATRDTPRAEMAVPIAASFSAIESLDMSRAEVLLLGGAAVAVGRAYRDELLARLELLP